MTRLKAALDAHPLAFAIGLIAAGVVALVIALLVAVS